MSTVRDTIAGAYRRLALLSLGDDLDAARAMAGLEELNNLFAAMQTDNVATDITLPLGINDAFPLDAKHETGVRAMLAVGLASESGIEAPASVQSAAKRGWRALLATYIVAPPADTDRAVYRSPSLPRWGVGGW